jgi:hypothetical protein
VDGSSMLKQPVCPFPINARHTLLMVTVPPATRDTISKVASASSLPLTALILPILDAVNGIGTPRIVLPALADGFSMLTTSALLFLINANPTITLVLALPATRVMTSAMVHVSSPPPTMPIQVILVAVYGLGIPKSVFSAPTTGSSTPTRHAYLSLTNVKLTTILVPASPASKDTILPTEPVFSLLQTTLSQAILDVLSGNGINKCAKHALTIGFSTPIKSVSQFQTNANQVMQMEIVPPVT